MFAMGYRTHVSRTPVQVVRVCQELLLYYTGGERSASGVRSNPSFDQILRTIRIDIGVTATLRCCPTELSSICLVEHVLNDPE